MLSAALDLVLFVWEFRESVRATVALSAFRKMGKEKITVGANGKIVFSRTNSINLFLIYLSQLCPS